ncbi:MAG: M23 family metallopeptidase [Cryobacterium sp.]|nr:M23 family metallopeptidase [Oligoflexia bacterium]
MKFVTERFFQSASFGTVVCVIIALGLITGCGSGDHEGDYLGAYGQQDPRGPSQIRFDQMELIFPVVGPTRYSDDWHQPRDGGAREHLGNDLIAKKMSPVVAVADGTVSWMHAQKGGECCYLGVSHQSQGIPYESRYIHLNSDSLGTTDGRVVGIAKGIRHGVRVKAGQLLGWVGNSGNARHTISHLHFELRDEFGRAVDPFTILKRAQPIEQAR